MATKRNLYEQHKDVLDDLARRGFPHVGQMAAFFSRSVDMDRALGFSAGASRHWLLGNNAPSMVSENACKHWLAAHGKSGTKAATVEAAPPQDNTSLLLVVAPMGTAEKVKRVLTMMGCEVEEV